MAKKTVEMSAGSELSHEAVTRRAHEIWESEGRPEGRASEHWFRAISEIETQRAGKSRGSDLNVAQQAATPRRPRARATEKRI